MSSTVLRHSDFKVSSWAGGQTTQLFIYPIRANYAACDFDFRLSSATVESENSDFTALPGFSRKLMIIEGEIEISHKNRYSKRLQPFDVDSFEGDLETSSVGLCTDFNVMTRSNYASNLYSMAIFKDKNQVLKASPNSAFMFIYLCKGTLLVHFANQQVSVSAGELLVIKKAESTEIEINATVDCRIICTEIAASK